MPMYDNTENAINAENYRASQIVGARPPIAMTLSDKIHVIIGAMAHVDAMTDEDLKTIADAVNGEIWRRI